MEEISSNSIVVRKKVVHISTDDYTGGASIAAYRFHKYLKEIGISSKMLVLQKTVKDDDSIQAIVIPKFFNILKKTLFKVFKILSICRVKSHLERGYFSYPILTNRISDLPLIQDVDIIILHWINRNYISIREINKIIKSKKRIIWYLHDMWPMTGGCHYSLDCEKYTEQCFKCPHLIKPKKKDWSYKLFKKKNNVFSNARNFEIFAPSSWIADCAKKSKIFSTKNITLLPNYLDLNIYRPFNKSFARDVFNLPHDKVLILFGAIDGINNPYKGWNYLKEALIILSKAEKDIYAVIFGSSYNQSIADNIPFPVTFSGHLSDSQSLCMLYNACNVFIVPSIADNLPNTIVESLACGTPVVAFNVGGIPDLIDHKKNGYLAKYKNSEDLAYGINWVIKNKKELELNTRAKIEALMSYSKNKIQEIFNETKRS